MKINNSSNQFVSSIEELVKVNETSMQKKAAKLNYSLLPPEPIESVIKVLMAGALKHADNGWKNFPDPVIYQNAIERHMAEIKKGNIIDPEFGQSHYAHIICSAVFLEWHRIQEAKKV